MFDRIVTTLAADVATNGTFTVAYPPFRTAGSYTGGFAHKMFANQTLYSAPASFTLAFTSVITVTWKGTTTLAAGTAIDLQADILGNLPSEQDKLIKPSVNQAFLTSTLVNLGSPVVGAAAAIFASAAINTGTPASPLVTTTLDVPRNIIAAWTGAAVMTVVGKDVYGVTMTESSPSGTAFTGKKAFKTITSINVSANVTAATVGTGNVLGLPVFLPQAGMVIGEMQDGAKPTAGTTVAGVASVATALTGDIRGTYTPNAAPDGAKAFSLILAVPDPSITAPVVQF